ncbi:hypothetical protein LguiA_033260 [Lonicera macranthoides]
MTCIALEFDMAKLDRVATNYDNLKQRVFPWVFSCRINPTPLRNQVILIAEAFYVHKSNSSPLHLVFRDQARAFR